jgi:CRISPR system Cascade subunit CasE
MFLSQLTFDPMNRKTMKTLSDFYALHQAVMCAFKKYGDRPRVLYRLEPEMHQEKVVVLVQSPVNPIWVDEDRQRVGMISARTKTYAPCMKRGSALRFRLRANPTVKREGKRYGLIRDEALEKWLIRWEERVGARFVNFNVIDEGYLKGVRGKQGIRIKTVRFDGRLIVYDTNAFLNHIVSGIGPAKGFGCGMLSISPA